MTIAGLVGGIGPESTIAYYRQIVALYRERTGGTYPPLVVNSIDLTHKIGLIGEGRLDEVTAFLAGDRGADALVTAEGPGGDRVDPLPGHDATAA